MAQTDSTIDQSRILQTAQELIEFEIPEPIEVDEFKGKAFEINQEILDDIGETFKNLTKEE